MSVKTLTATDIADLLTRLCVEVASTAYRRRNPQASDEEALLWGMKNGISFVSEALDVLILVALVEVEKRAFSGGQET